MPVRCDCDGWRGNRGAVAEVLDLPVRGIHADPTPADVPVRAGKSMAPGERDALYKCYSVRTNRRAQDRQTVDIHVGPSEDTQHCPLVMAVTGPAGDTYKILNIPHVGRVPVPRIEADFNLGIVRSVNRVAVGGSSRLAVSVNRHVVVRDDPIAIWRSLKIMHLSGRAGNIEGDRVPVAQTVDGSDQVGFAGAEISIVFGVDGDDCGASGCEAGDNRCQREKRDEFFHRGSGNEELLQLSVQIGGRTTSFSFAGQDFIPQTTRAEPTATQAGVNRERPASNTYLRRR